jgi:membrane protein YdbS with pleckstrin-like domain
VVTIFTIEYALRIWSDEKPIKFAFSWEGLIDLGAILPFYLAKFGIGDSLEFLLVLRLLRLLKFATMYGYEQESIIRQAKKHGNFYILPNEIVERVVQKHPIVFLFGLLLPLFFVSAGLVIFVFGHDNVWALGFMSLMFIFAVVFFIKAWLDYKYDVIYITNYRVILQNQELFGSTVNTISYNSITNIIPSDLGFFRWILGIGNIEIETANRDATIRFDNVFKPHKLVQKISENRNNTEKNSPERIKETAFPDN